MRVYVEDWRRGRDTRKRERTLFTEERITYKENKGKYEILLLTQQQKDIETS